jgi:AmmeMemoRadiSam system protein B/AmmeMemoRadiSam system protein A
MMKKTLLGCIFFILLGRYHGMVSAAGMNPDLYAGIRQPAVAGRFYPGDPLKLARAIHAYLEDAEAPVGEKPIAIIAPHAGYIFSGQICADAFNQAVGQAYDLIVLLGTNHTTPEFAGVSIYPEGGYQTPLGIARIDGSLSAELIAGAKEFTFKEFMHVREHSIEVLVPFVQILFPEAKIVTAIVGTPDLDICARFGQTLANVLRGKRALIVASSDLSHYPGYKDAVRVDRITLEAILTQDPGTVQKTLQKQMAGHISNLATCACGQAPILTAMIAAKALGANCAKIISYANSGNASVGSRDRVVGYGAVSFTANQACTHDKPAPEAFPKSLSRGMNDHHKSVLIAFARKTIQQFLTADTTPLARGFDPVLFQKQGAFVTLKKHGNLRGCIGHMAEDLPLCQVVGSMALQAAFNDRRFTNVTLKELPEIDIEISVLTPFQPIKEVEDIIIGRDGVVLRKNDRSAVFLPQVPVEQGWDRNQLLDRLSQKAGLAAGSWRDGAQLYTFQANVFKESDLK